MVCRKNGVIMLHIYGDGSCESAVDRVDVVMYFRKTCNDPVIVFRLLLRALVTHFLPFHIQCVITVSTQSFVFRSLSQPLSLSFFLVFFPFHSNGFSMPAAAVSINKSKCMWNYYPERREREKLHFALDDVSRVQMMLSFSVFLYGSSDIEQSTEVMCHEYSIQYWLIRIFYTKV